MIEDSVEKELSPCCGAKIVEDCFGDPSVPGCTQYFSVCSKCGQGISDDGNWNSNKETIRD